MRASLLLLLALTCVACGSTVGAASPDTSTGASSDVPDVSLLPPVDGSAPALDRPIPATDVGPDAPPPAIDRPMPAPTDSPCATERLLQRASVLYAQMALSDGGPVLAWITTGPLAMHVQAYDDALSPRGPEMVDALPHNILAAPVHVLVRGTTVVAASGSSMVFATLGPDGSLAFSGRADAHGRSVRGLGAPASGMIRGFLDQGGVLLSDGSRTNTFEPNAGLAPPHSARATFFADLSGHWTLDPIATSGGERVLLRSFLYGHGASVLASTSAGDGAFGSFAVRHGGEIVRITAAGERSLSARLERRDAETLGLLSDELLEADTAWNRVSGAIEEQGEDPSVVWAARPAGSGSNNALKVRGLRAEAPRTVHLHPAEANLEVWSILPSRVARRHWVLFTASESAVSRLYARCFVR